MGNDKKFRNKIAVIILISCFAILGFIVIYPYITTLNEHADTQSLLVETLDSTSSLFSGIIGVIIGYYFNEKS